MKKFTALFMLFFMFTAAYSQEENEDTDTLGWRTGGIASLNFSQVSLYQWSQGGEGSTAGAALFNMHANYIQLDETWENSLSLGYGLVKQGGMTRKSNDRIEFSSKYGRELVEKWYYSALVNFRTQFDDGYKYPEDTSKVLISRFMAPAYLTGSLGFDYKPDKHFNMFISPVTAKLTMVFDDTIAAKGNFGLEPGEEFRAELGGFLKFAYVNEIMENVELNTTIDFFSNYLNNPQNIDINWEFLLSMKINEYLSATLNTIMIYDDDVNLYKGEGETEPDGPGWQIKEVFGLGLSYQF